MRIALDCNQTFKPNQTPDFSTVTGMATVAGAALTFQPDDWSKVNAHSGDTPTPTNGQSYLSIQPNGDLQWRQSAAQWETLYALGAFVSINPSVATGGTGPTFTYLFAQVGQ